MKKYEHYKNSGVEWLGEIPEHWKIARLKNIIKSKITDGPHTTPEFIENGIPFLSVDGIQDGELVFENCRKISLNDHIKFQKKCKIEKFDILMGKAASIGKIAQAKVDFEFSIWSPLALIKPKLTITNSTFLEYYLKSTLAQYQIEILCTSNTQKNISMDDIPKIISTLPPLSEQEKIANFLDDKTTKIDQAIVIKQKQIELLKERRQILIHKAVTRGLNDNVKLKDSGVEWIGEIPEHWEMKRLKDVCSINLNSLPENTNKNFEFKYVDIGSVSLENGINNIEEYTFKNAPSRARRIAEKGDTIISTVRTYLKAIDFVDELKSTYVYSTGFAVLHPKEFIYPEFLGNFVRSDAFTEQVTVNSKGMSYPAINSTDIGRLVVVHCGFEEQKQIVEFIETATKKIATAISLKEQEIDKLKEYKMSLIDGVVTGKVKVC